MTRQPLGVAVVGFGRMGRNQMVTLYVGPGHGDYLAFQSVRRGDWVQLPS